MIARSLSNATIPTLRRANIASGKGRPSDTVFSRLYGFIRHESLVTWALCQANFSAHVAGFLGGLIPRLIFVPVSPIRALVAFLRVMIPCLTWNYLFDIANTTTAIDEDKLNKPHRPIPSGLITVRQARISWILSWLSAPLAMYLIFDKWVALYAILWEAWTVVFYVWPAYEHWFLKNLMTTGTIFMILRLVNSILYEFSAWRIGAMPDLLVCSWTILTIHVSDFRDIEGDRKTHTSTLPLLLSLANQVKLRWATACLMMAGAVLSMGWILTSARASTALWTGIPFQASSGILALYTAGSSSVEDDRTAYRWWVYTGFFLINHATHLYILS